MSINKIINIIPNFNFGGVEKTNLTLTEDLRRLGYDVELLTNNIIDSNFIENNNIKIKSFNKPKMIFSVFDLLKYIKSKNPDLIICSQFYANIVVIICCILAGYKNKIVICERVPVLENLKNISLLKRKILELFIKKLYPKVNCVVTNSHGTKIELKKLVNNVNTEVIYNPVLSDQISSLSKETIDDYIFDHKYIYLTTIARISYEKNIADMIKIVSKIDTTKKFKFLIIGDGPKIHVIKKQVSDLGLNEFVDFLGFKSNPYKYLKNCDLYLSTSKFEGMGNSIVEALYFGLNIVSYNSPGGIAEILGHGKFGHLIQNGDINNFSKALNTNMQKKNVSKSKLLNNHLKLFYSDIFAKQFVKLINEISNE